MREFASDTETRANTTARQRSVREILLGFETNMALRMFGGKIYVLKDRLVKERSC